MAIDANIKSVVVAGAMLPVSSQMKLLGVVLDTSLSFDDHARAVVKSCNYHTRAIRHVRHLLTESTAQTLTCSLINSRLDYCNTVRRLRR
jgi:hypothetical protein